MQMGHGPSRGNAFLHSPTDETRRIIERRSDFLVAGMFEKAILIEKRGWNRSFQPEDDRRRFFHLPKKFEVIPQPVLDEMNPSGKKISEILMCDQADFGTKVRIEVFNNECSSVRPFHGIDEEQFDRPVSPRRSFQIADVQRKIFTPRRCALIELLQK